MIYLAPPHTPGLRTEVSFFTEERAWRAARRLWAWSGVPFTVVETRKLMGTPTGLRLYAVRRAIDDRQVSLVVDWTRLGDEMTVPLDESVYRQGIKDWLANNPAGQSSGSTTTTTTTTE